MCTSTAQCALFTLNLYQQPVARSARIPFRDWLPGNLFPRHPGREFTLGDLKPIGRRSTCEQIHIAGDESRPSRLMAGADACAIVPVEKLIEQNVISPIRIFLKLLCPAIHRTVTACVAHKYA